MIAVRENNTNVWVILRDEDITHIEQFGEESKTYVNTVDKKVYQANVNLIKFNGILDNTVFFRAHRNKWINVKQHLKKITVGGVNIAEFNNGVKVEVSRRNVSDLVKFCNPVNPNKYSKE